MGSSSGGEGRGAKITTLHFRTRTVMQGFHVAHELWLEAWPDVVIRAKTLDEARRWMFFLAMRLQAEGSSVDDLTFTLPAQEATDGQQQRG